LCATGNQFFFGLLSFHAFKGFYLINSPLSDPFLSSEVFAANFAFLIAEVVEELAKCLIKALKSVIGLRSSSDE
jgi:hypothetical protein